MENRRVVITGMGTVSPIGNTVEKSWDSLVNGRSGIGKITYFDTSLFKAKLDAEVKDFNPRDWMEKQDMLRSDKYVHYAFAATTEAIADSGIEGTVDPERFAVYYGSGIGGICTFSAEMRKLIDRGPGRVSPFLIPMMIPNMAAGMLAIRFGCKNAAIPAVTACASGTNAIGEAVRAIRHGYADAAITGGQRIRKQLPFLLTEEELDSSSVKVLRRLSSRNMKGQEKEVLISTERSLVMVPPAMHIT